VGPINVDTQFVHQQPLAIKDSSVRMDEGAFYLVAPMSRARHGAARFAAPASVIRFTALTRQPVAKRTGTRTGVRVGIVTVSRTGDVLPRCAAKSRAFRSITTAATNISATPTSPNRIDSEKRR